MTLPETASSRRAATEGLPCPLGPTNIEEEDAYDFALYSKHAESVTLLLHTSSDIVNPVLACRFDYLKNRTGRLWHCRIPLVSMRGASYYAYRVEGPTPNGRFEWHWFDRDERFDWQGDHRPRHEADTVIYELHGGGFTKNSSSGVRDEARGTCAGLVEKIPYLKDLGITVAELMPVFR